jgi:hypothetical protein
MRRSSPSSSGLVSASCRPEPKCLSVVDALVDGGHARRRWGGRQRARGSLPRQMREGHATDVDCSLARSGASCFDCATVLLQAARLVRRLASRPDWLPRREPFESGISTPRGGERAFGHACATNSLLCLMTLTELP